MAYNIYMLVRGDARPDRGSRADFDHSFVLPCRLLCIWQGRDVVNKTECLCVRWAIDGSNVAAGGGDGAVRLYEGKQGQLVKTLGTVPQAKPGGMSLGEPESPVMAMRWNPKQAGRLRVAKTDGCIDL